METATIKLFLTNGMAKSLRTAEISNWTGKALAAPRTEFDQLLTRDELSNPGVYILIGTDSNSNFPMTYIGEAECVKDRIKKHKEKEFWVQAIVFISKDENLTKAHIKYLEGRLIEKAKEIGKTKLDNSQTSGAVLPESDRADMDVFFNKIEQLLPVLGSDVLVPIADKEVINEDEKLICQIKEMKAFGKRTSNGFVIFKGSQAVIQNRNSISDNDKKKRQELVDSGVLSVEGNKYIFTKDFETTSPSVAAMYIRGGNENGLIQWKDSQGKTLKDIERTIEDE